MVSFKNEKIYQQTMNHIFSADEASHVLNLKMINVLFQENNIEPVDKEFIVSLQEFYGTSTLTKNNLKKRDMELEFDKELVSINMKSDYKENNNILKEKSLIERINKIDKTISNKDIINYLNKYITKENDKFSYDDFEKHIFELIL